MKDYSNYHMKSINKIKNDAQIVASATFRDIESEDVIINGSYSTKVYIYDKFSSTASMKYMIDQNNNIDYGDLIKRENEEIWIATSFEKDNPLFQMWITKRCQCTLKWIDEDRNVQEHPCLLEYNTKSNFGEKDDKVMTIPDGRRQVVLRKDDNTIKLRRTNRFFIGDEIFEVVDYAYVSDFGLVNLSLKTSKINPAVDNEELGIADYYQKINKYDLKLITQDNISIKFDQSYQLEVQALKNGEQVDINEIAISSSDTNVGTVDDTGLFTPVDEGTTIITFEYMGISKGITVRVRDRMMKNLTVDIEGSDSIRLGKTERYVAVFKNNGHVVDEICDFTLGSTDLATVEEKNNNFISLKANSKSKTGKVILRVKSNNGLTESMKEIIIKGYL